MSRLDRPPAIVEALLNPGKVPHTPPDLPKSPPAKISRLKGLCCEMAARILEETDDRRFGDIDAMINEADTLAFDLGFPSPPVERIKYDRSVDYEAVRAKEIHRVGRAGVAFGWGETMSLWPVYQHSHPALVRVFGYRFHDPDRGSPPMEIAVASLCETDDPAKPKIYDPLESTSKTEERSEGVKRLHRWVRFIDAGDMGTEESRDDGPEVTNAGGSGSGSTVAETVSRSAGDEIGDVPLSPKQIAMKHGLDYERLRKRLTRRRRHDLDCCIENESRSGQEAQFLFWESRVQDVITSLKERQKTSRLRPSEKKTA